MTSQQYLENILSVYNLKDNDVKMIKSYRSYIEKLLREIFESKVHTIYYSGSYAKGTAINKKYDLDICIYFKKNSFQSIRKMYEDVFEKLNYLNGELNELFEEESVIVPQNVSIGIFNFFDIDIVPAMKIDEESDYAKLYVKDTDSSIRTNIPLHIDYISKHKCRPIIKLIKIWKLNHKIIFKSFGLELLIIKALKNCNSEDFGDQFLHVLNFIKNEIEKVKLVDPANSNNIVSNLINYNDKINIKNQAISSLEKQYWKEIIW